MNQQMSLIELFRIPDFIDTSSTTDVNSWRAARNIIDLYYIMGNSKTILSNEIILNINKKIKLHLSEIEQYDNPFLLYNLLIKRKEYIQNILIQNEEYEGLANLKKYEEI